MKFAQWYCRYKVVELMLLALFFASPVYGQALKHKSFTKQEIVLGVIGQEAALADELTTVHNLDHGTKELDPLARPFTRLPEPLYITSGVVLTGGLTIIAHHARSSNHKIVRIFGRIAQPIQIGLNAGNAINNYIHQPPVVSTGFVNHQSK